jgi:UDP-N-acetylglucosamine transferase subunit ALG13
MKGCQKVFVSVGTQLPFDRLIIAIDDFARQNPGYSFFAQIGAGGYRPEHIDFKDFIDMEEYNKAVTECDLLVAHAGMGAILTALEAGKPIVIMPRKAKLGEHRNDHQLATAARFADMGKVLVAMEESDLGPCLLEGAVRKTSLIGPHASEDLLEAVRTFLHT